MLPGHVDPPAMWPGPNFHFADLVNGCEQHVSSSRLMKITGGIAVAALAASVLVGCQSSSGGKSGSGTSSNVLQHAEDVTITSCVADPTTHYLDAKVKVTNHSSKPSNYSITIAFNSKDGATQLDTGLVAVDNLGAGQASDQDAIGLKAAPAGGYVCKVADVTRFAA